MLNSSSCHPRFDVYTCTEGRCQMSTHKYPTVQTRIYAQHCFCKGVVCHGHPLLKTARRSVTALLNPTTRP